MTRPTDPDYVDFEQSVDRNPDAHRLAARLRATQGSSSAELAAELLCAPDALMQLSMDEARVVVACMKPMRIARGTMFIAQGDRANNDYMVLLLDGEVTVENFVVSRTSPVTLSVLGAGSLIGEMGLVDGEPRSASCTATTDVRAASFSRAALEDLLEDDPRTAAKLLMAVAQRIASRMRDNADKLKLFTQLTQTMQQEIERLAPTPTHLMQENR